MIKKLLSAALLTVTVSVNAQQVQNSGFETWANTFPTGWGTVGQMAVGLGQPNPNTEIQTATKHSGSSAVLIQNQFLAFLSSNIQGAICTGPITFAGNKPTLGFQAYSSMPTSYDFWYQFTATSGDTASTRLYITKWNMSNGKRDTLAKGGNYIIGVASVYTQMTIPITWLITGITPDSIQLFFTSSIKNVGGTTATPPTGGQLYIDDVNFTAPVGIQTLMADGSFTHAYPNPAVNVITISSNLEKAKYVKVFDLTGCMVNTYEINNKLAKIDLSSYESGMYIYVVTDEHTNRLHTAKFNVVK